MTVHQWLDCRTHHELEYLTGHLARAATFIHPGHIFLHPLLALTAAAAKPHHFVYYSLTMHDDLH